MRSKAVGLVIRLVIALTPLLTCTSGVAADFPTRCNNPAVVRCVSFDSPSDISGGYGSNSGIFPGAATPAIDTAVKASGAGALKFTIPSNSPSDSSGSYFTNFSSNLSTQFGPNQEFFIQWRQRFSSEFLNTTYQGGGGWKQLIVGTGDVPGGTPSTSCTDLETVVQNTDQRGFAQMYNSCSGSTSHGPYNPFEQPFNAFDFKMQNARPSPYCLYSQGNTNPKTFFPPSGNCFGYFANQWMTFQMSIKTGPRVNDEFTNSYIKLWIAKEGQPSELVFDWGPYNLTAGSAAQNQRFGKVWLLPYHTGKSSSQSHPVGYTWYDELIIATAKIADPDGANNQTPAPPQNLTAN
jgi:hypothetical protein